jgi:hypothetical protein
VAQQDFVLGSVDCLGHDHGLTAWQVTLYSISRYLNKRYLTTLGRGGLRAESPNYVDRRSTAHLTAAKRMLNENSTEPR